MKTFLERLSERESLSEQEMQEAVSFLFSNEISDSEIAAFLIGLKTKGETVEEIAGLVRGLRERSVKFTKEKFSGVMDNCGTGGDGSGSFNISTTAAFVIAGAGVTVAKHGNRSISSKTGSADVLEHLGVHLNLEQRAIEEILEEIGIAFLFAPSVHPQVKRIMKVRKDLRIPTVFNLIGPLTNPIDLDHQLLGIYRRDLIDMFANVLEKLGRKRAVVLNGAGHLDEASLQGENHLVILDKGLTQRITIHPEELGLSVYENHAIKGGDSKINAEILRRVLTGEKGAYLDTVLLNAGIGLFAAGKAESFKSGVQLARESVESGSALSKLELLIEKSQAYQKEVI